MNYRKLVKLFIPKSLFGKIEPYGHWLEALLWHVSAGFPARKMKIIGVTGTNGKTTTSFLIHKMLAQAGYNVGLMSTVAYGVNDDIRQQIHHMTNVPVPELVKRLKWMRQQGVEWLVLETTSHALAQNRVAFVPYSLAVMTNVTHEHLDFHKTFENYVNAKRRLFKITNANKKGLRAGIINAEDPSAAKFASDVENPVTYGVNKGDMRASDVKLAPSGVSYTAKIGEASYRIKCQIPGSFNVYNSLAAACVGRVLGLSKQQIEQGIAALESVEGRMTRIDEGQDFDVIVDFAHTPDSFEKIFRDIRLAMDSVRASHLDAAQGSKEERASRTGGTMSERQTPADAALRQKPERAAGSASRQGQAVRGSEGKLIVMFGSAGRRDEAKRAVQGELAGRYCDEVIITEEDDRDIDGQEIMNQIAGGAKKAGKVQDKDLFLVHDRPEAINFAVNRAKKGDTVLLLGKGHEKTIERKDGEHPWNEIETAHQALKNLS